jgi:O-succinylbenzoic acid--CoA ligase
VALVTPEREWTWSELAVAAAPTAAWLRERSAALACEGSPRLALVGALRAETAIAVYAAIEARVPFLMLHPRWSAAERRQAVDEHGIEVVLDESLRPLALSGSNVVVGSATAVAKSSEDEGNQASKDGAVEDGSDSASLLAVLLTSGTGGRPKGVALSRGAFLASARASAANLGWRPSDRWLVNLPLAHIGGLSVLTRTLIARSAAVLAPEAGFDVETTIEIAREQRVSLLSVVPTMLHRMLARRPRVELPQTVRAILVGGARAPSPLLTEARARGWPVLATYGMTETCSQVATQRLGQAPGAGDVGALLPGFEVEIAARAGLQDGEIRVRGPALFSGYTTGGTVAPALDEGGWFATGDLGRVDPEGRLIVTGRVDDRVISGGENIDPSEVEAVLEAHPGIAEALVFGVEDAEWGERLAAALRPHGAPVPAADLRAFLAPRLAGYKRPRLIAWVDDLPTAASGKRDRGACAAALAGKLRALDDEP